MLTKLDRTIFNEAAFARFLSLERKRTDRSCRPFLLLLVELRVLPWGSRYQRRVFVSNLIASLQTCVRQTDILGWYKHRTAIGVIYTDLRQEASAVSTIQGKIDAALRARLTSEQLKAVVLSAHLYPSQDNRVFGYEPSDKLYPDLKHKHVGRVLKRLLDILGSIALLLLLTPVFLAVVVVVKCTSKGPILFKQTRLGQFGKPFTFLKFRSMYEDADSRAHEQYVKAFILQSKNGHSDTEALKQNGFFKLSHDSRITPVGSFLRKTSIDELPQLLNVLVGSMSLVGPRPPIPYEVKDYDAWHMRRVLEARPGITGPWQVGGRSLMPFVDMVRLDLKYIDEWSLWTDIKLLLQTPHAVLKREGAG